MTIPGLTSIVILTRNGLHLTQQCVKSIQERTPQPYELIFVDNGSTDQTLNWLAEHTPDALVIANDANLGFGAGCNQGMACARGEYILLLNNDTIVTDGWLDQMLEALATDPRHGFAGPVSNSVAGVQKIPVEYDQQTAQGLDEWAKNYTAGERGRFYECNRLIGFCLLFRREVIEKIGGFDLRYGLGNFEDDDICLRAGVAGYCGVIAAGSFVHHYGGQTFAAENIDYITSMHQGWETFKAIWRMHDHHLAEGGGYYADQVIADTQWDQERHLMPLIACPPAGERVEGSDQAMLLLPIETEDLQSSLTALEAMVVEGLPAGHQELLLRVDPRHEEVWQEIENRLAQLDAQGHAIPPLSGCSLSALNDQAAYAACRSVLIHGRRSLAHKLMALRTGCAPLNPALENL